MTVEQLAPGTRIQDSDVFDLAMSWRGYRINKFCMGLANAANRAAFKADEEAYLAKSDLTEEEKAMVRARASSSVNCTGGDFMK